MDKPKVKIYSTPTCVWCRATKEFLDEHKIGYEDINVASDATAREYMSKRSGQMGVPVIEIGNEIIIGFDKARISELLGIRTYDIEHSALRRYYSWLGCGRFVGGYLRWTILDEDACDTRQFRRRDGYSRANLELPRRPRHGRLRFDEELRKAGQGRRGRSDRWQGYRRD